MASPPHTKTLYFDESGNTGLKLLDPVQRFFSVASTDLSEKEASTIIDECFPSRGSADLKFKVLIANWRNFDGLTKFAQHVGSDPSRYFCFLMDKRYALLCRLLDWFVEPYYHARGFDWYKDDYGRSYANTFNMSFQVDQAENLLLEITQLYEDFAKSPNKDQLSHMQSRFRELANGDTKNVSRFMGHLADGADEFEEHWSLDKFNDSSDIHVTSIVSSVAWWRSQYDEDFDIVHDESNHFFDRQGLWDLVSDMSASEAVAHVGPKSIQFPLRVRSTRPGNSEISRQLQVCDLIAGFCAKSRSHKLKSDQKQQIERMIVAGMGQLNFDSVSPGDNFATGMPPRATGPDAVDIIARSIFKK